MYYVIKRQIGIPLVTFIGFKVPKYIASKNSENIIFEFTKDGKADRKWVKKNEIILLTKDKTLFLKTMEKFKAVEETQKKLVDDAKNHLEKSMETMTETMNTEIENFEEFKYSTAAQCFLKDL